MIRKVMRALGNRAFSRSRAIPSPPSNTRSTLSVLIVPPSKTKRGGIVNATLAHALGLHLRGHAVEVWTASQPLAELLQTHGICVFLHPAVSSAIMLNLSRAVRVRGRKLREAGVNAVLHESAKSYVWSRLSMRRALHAIVFHNRKLGGRRRFDHWFVLSHMHAANLASDPTNSEGKSVQVIRNGYVPTNGACSAVPRSDEPQGRHRSYRIGTLCELVHRKGVDLLLEAVTGSIAAGIPVELKVGGGRPRRSGAEESSGRPRYFRLGTLARLGRRPCNVLQRNRHLLPAVAN